MRVFPTVATGEIGGSATASQLPDVSCSLVKFKAEADNSGKVYLGTSNAATVADGSTDVTTGYALVAGEESPWLPIPNLKTLWRICDNAGDDLTYIALVS